MQRLLSRGGLGGCPGALQLQSHGTGGTVQCQQPPFLSTAFIGSGACSLRGSRRSSAGSTLGSVASYRAFPLVQKGAAFFCFLQRKQLLQTNSLCGFSAIVSAISVSPALEIATGARIWIFAVDKSDTQSLLSFFLCVFFKALSLSVRANVHPSHYGQDPSECPAVLAWKLTLKATGTDRLMCVSMERSPQLLIFRRQLFPGKNVLIN